MNVRVEASGQHAMRGNLHERRRRPCDDHEREADPPRPPFRGVGRRCDDPQRARELDEHQRPHDATDARRVARVEGAEAFGSNEGERWVVRDLHDPDQPGEGPSRRGMDEEDPAFQAMKADAARRSATRSRATSEKSKPHQREPVRRPPYDRVCRDSKPQHLLYACRLGMDAHSSRKSARAVGSSHASVRCGRRSFERRRGRLTRSERGCERDERARQTSSPRERPCAPARSAVLAASWRPATKRASRRRCAARTPRARTRSSRSLAWIDRAASGHPAPPVDPSFDRVLARARTQRTRRTRSSSTQRASIRGARN